MDTHAASDRHLLANVLSMDEPGRPLLQTLAHTLLKHKERMFLVGGAVRDSILGFSAKDLDVITTAPPNLLRRLGCDVQMAGLHFPHYRVSLEGLRFEAIEFRESIRTKLLEMGLSDRAATLQVLRLDAIHRDFRLNAMYIDLASGELYDPMSGKTDAVAREVNTIGEAVCRLRGDPLRILRAIRLSSKLGCSISTDLDGAIRTCAGLLPQIAHDRLLMEVARNLTEGSACVAIKQWSTFGLWGMIASGPVPSHEGESNCSFMMRSFRILDEHVGVGGNCPPTLAFAVLLWPRLQEIIHNNTSASVISESDVSSAFRSLMLEQPSYLDTRYKYIEPLKRIFKAQFSATRELANPGESIIAENLFRLRVDFGENCQAGS